eukprot:13010608-Ditylum_brightwellii.AAC.1
MSCFKLFSIFCIIKRSSSRTGDAGGSLVDVVKGNSELISHAIIAPVVVEFKQCDAMGVMTVLNNAGVLFPFLPVNLAEFLEESGVDAFVDSRVGVTNGFVVELDNMM